MVTYVDTVVAVTLMREGARFTAMMVWGWMRCGGECRACGWYTWFRYCV